MASRDAFENDGQNHHTWDTQHGYITRLFPKTPRVIISFNIYVKAIKYLNSPISVVELAQRDIKNERRGLQMHQPI